MISYSPSPWTHHHTHRLFHLSMGLCFGFIGLVLVAGMTMLWFTAGADTTNIPSDTQITATVGGINPGPVTGGGGTVYPTPSVTPTPTPSTTPATVTIHAEPRDEIKQRPIAVTGVGQNILADVFETNYPAYSGSSSFHNTLLFIQVTGEKQLNSTARTDASGNWYWISPEALQNGTYKIVVTGYNLSNTQNSASATRYYVVETSKQPSTPTPVPTGGSNYLGNGGSSGSSGGSSGNGGVFPPVPSPTPHIFPTPPPIINPPGTGPGTNVPGLPFGIYVKIQHNYERIEAGNKILADIIVTGISGKQNDSQDVTYTIRSANGTVIMESTDTISYSMLSEFTKTFLTAPGTKPGIYTVVVRSTYRGITSSSSDTFTLGNPTPVGSTVSPSRTPGDLYILWLILFLLFLLFLILAYIAYHHVRTVSELMNRNEGLR